VHLSEPQVRQFWTRFPGWAGGFHIQLSRPPTRALCPVIPNNACHLRLTAAAGTKLAVASSRAFVKLKSYSPSNIS
jgi:hypothetical protein